MQTEVANVWLRSRVPGADAKLRDHIVIRPGGPQRYGDLTHAGRRFRFSHTQSLVGLRPGERELWLVFEDKGAA